MIDRRIVGDLEYPGGELVLRAVRFDRVQRLDEGLLCEILGELAVAHHAVEQREERALVAPHELPIRRLLSPPGECNDLLVRPGGQLRPTHRGAARLRSGPSEGYIERLC